MKKIYGESLDEERSRYYSSRITSAAGDTKKLFGVVKDISGDVVDSIYPSNIQEKDLPEAFAAYFTQKVKNIRKDIQRFQVGRGDELLENREIELDKELLDFKLITLEDLKTIFKIMTKKNYHHDQIQFLIILCSY